MGPIGGGVVSEEGRDELWGIGGGVVSEEGRDELWKGGMSCGGGRAQGATAQYTKGTMESTLQHDRRERR